MFRELFENLSLFIVTNLYGLTTFLILKKKFKGLKSGYFRKFHEKYLDGKFFLKI